MSANAQGKGERGSFNRNSPREGFQKPSLVPALPWNKSCICNQREPRTKCRAERILTPMGETQLCETMTPEGFPGVSDGKESACNVGGLGSIPGLGRSPGGGHGNPLQYSCLENPRDRGAWRATIRGKESDTTQWLNTAHEPAGCAPSCPSSLFLGPLSPHHRNSVGPYFPLQYLTPMRLRNLYFHLLEYIQITVIPFELGLDLATSWKERPTDQFDMLENTRERNVSNGPIFLIFWQISMKLRIQKLQMPYMVGRCCWIAKSCLTLCDPIDYSLPGSSVHGIFQARVLEQVTISSSRGSSRPRNRICVSCIAGESLPLSHLGLYHPYLKAPPYFF